MVRIAFHANQLSERGCEVALYDYCLYNQQLLGNRSVVFYPDRAPGNDASVVERFARSFELVPYEHFEEVDDRIRAMNLDLFYAIKGGEIDGVVSRAVPSMIHAVFAQSPFEIHGSSYAFISEWLALKCSAGLVPAVPFMVHAPLGLQGEGFRRRLGIPEQSVVLGSYGGGGSFDIVFVREQVIPKALEQRLDLHFVFMNYDSFIDHPRVHFLPRSTDTADKQVFVAACDAMLHARRQGESFGLACAEFSAQRKPVFTYGDSPDRHHLYVLRSSALVYRTPDQLLQMLLTFQPNAEGQGPMDAYLRYTPDRVMDLFDRHLIHPARQRAAIGLQLTLATLPLRRPFSPLFRRAFWHLQILWRRFGKLTRFAVQVGRT